MLSAIDKERLAQQAAAAHGRAQDGIARRQEAALRPTPGGGKALTSKTSKPKAPTKKSAGAAPMQPGRPEVAPYLDAQGLGDLGNRLEYSDNARAQVTNDFQNQAAEAYRGAQQAGIDRVAGADAVEQNTAARGLGRSSIRDAGLDKVDATAAQTTSNLRGQLALKAVQGQGQLRTIGRGDDSAYAALAARAAELAAAVPRADQPQQVKAQAAAKNVKGAKTLRRAK